jgi:hypothetical protein
MNKPITRRIKSYEVDTNREHKYGIKSAIVWGHSRDTNSVFPLLYLTKPKGMTQEDYEYLLKKINILIEK